MYPGRPARILAKRQPDWKTFTAATLLAASLSIPQAITIAAPEGTGAVVSTVAQNVDYISTGSGAALDLGFPVLVPSWVPGPFGGEPSIDAGGGYYSLYWMNGGGEPTFLQVSGVVGGGLPAGSPYDLNIQLSVNASVNGYGAIHDVTPIYDTVWWIQGGVLYTVTSRNMTGTDSLSLANSLITFVPPAAQEPEPEPEPEPTIPPPVQPEPAQPTDQGDSSSPDSGSDSGSSQPDTTAAEDSGGTTSDPGSPDTGTSDTAPDEEAVATVTSDPVGSDGTGAPSVASDGTGGPPVEVVPSDGTGGASDVVVIPRKLPELAPTP